LAAPDNNEIWVKRMIGVIGATGKIGGELVKSLRAKGVAFKCIVRDPQAALQKLGPEVTLATGDLSDPESLVAAFEGLDRLFLICGLHQNLAQLETNAIEAAKRAGVSAIVKSSAAEPIIAADSPTLIGRQHLPVEQALQESGLEWTILRPTFLMQNSLSQSARVTNEAKLAMPVKPDVEISFIDTRDIGASAAVVLTEGGHASRIYTLTGVKITLGEAVDTFSRTLRREIEYAFVPEETARSNMDQHGMPEWMKEHFLGMGRLLSEGRLTLLTDDVRRITGREPHDYASYVSNNIKAFGG
jgi:uncharacterized protein YbjT (DUF2867 family)